MLATRNFLGHTVTFDVPRSDNRPAHQTADHEKPTGPRTARPARRRGTCQPHQLNIKTRSRDLALKTRAREPAQVGSRTAASNCAPSRSHRYQHYRRRSPKMRSK
ncbi:Uncharacterised protein [Mycobacteroides abscessus subsp. abscessus]|nr:Uncharacterised protein [Mycobacteroides abscessus subsp. abscessus]